METKKRDYLFDNYKALLIILVVVGHFVEIASGDNSFLYAMKWIIFSFHMPAFIFISGYFSQKKYPVDKLFQKLIVPYLIFELLYYLLYTYVTHKDTELYLLYPKFSLWYLMALFVWKWVTPWVKKIPGHVSLAFLAGLAVGASALDDNFLTLPRMITFYPFFLMGVEFDRRWLERFRTESRRMGAGVLLLALNLLLIWAALDGNLSLKIFYGRYSYDYLDFTVPEGILIRVMCYIISLLMTLLFAMLLPDRKTSWSYLGSRTMAVYLFHGLVYSCFKMGKSFYHSLPNAVETLVLVGCSLLVVWILSRKPFMDFINYISNLHLPKSMPVKWGVRSN